MVSVTCIIGKVFYLTDTGGKSYTCSLAEPAGFARLLLPLLFSPATGVLKENCPRMEKAMLADSLLGMELLEDIPDSGTISPSSMDRKISVSACKNGLKSNKKV